MKAKEEDALIILEELVDAYGLEGVLYALGDVCAYKADHLEVNWQDKTNAAKWQRHSFKLTKLADGIKQIGS